MRECSKCEKLTANKSWCVDCQREYNKQYKANNKEKIKTLTQNWREANKEAYKEMKYAYYKSQRGRIVDLYRSAKRRAKEKNLPCELTTDVIETMWTNQNGRCALTNIEFKIPQERTCGKASPFAPSVDRIDCNLGYTVKNTRLVCVAVNYALNEFGEDVFKIICEAYLKR